MSEEQSSFPENNPQPANPFDQHMNPGQPGSFHFQMPLPNATVVLVLGILSIVTCCCYGIIGLILAILALVLAGKDRKLYTANPSAYTMSSFKNLNTGRVCALIGVIMSALVALFYIGMIVIFGLSVLSDPEAFREAMGGLQ